MKIHDPFNDRGMIHLWNHMHATHQLSKVQLPPLLYFPLHAMYVELKDCLKPLNSFEKQPIKQLSGDDDEATQLS